MSILTNASTTFCLSFLKRSFLLVLGFLPFCRILTFSFSSYKDVNRLDADFSSFQVGLLDWGALYDTPDVDLQVSLLTDFVNHLYRVCVPVRWKLTDLYLIRGILG
jgi:hypothetical protein